MATKVQKIMVQPIKTRVQIWLYEQVDLRIEGQIIGFDEFMNLVLDDAEEINVKKKSRKSLGRILLKGDNITLIQSAT
ncbi:5645_t:CDS:2 [Entrophospora sp. SA101]|nr:2937_t:CDS:2 [Entrophospora candida]CAH1765210.1 12869_t:CDS:2 [Entrophospora sp. SA101]CAJ0638389.1 11765_t:CDS:2 [Entrophospora sp. SA101]CAJ0748556.1 5645_t:CDS:2 [Entrophospora sp. SA101]CAJ0830589.1 9740_t:CDS:2 [Entrophospora sp. SA101]